MAFPYKKVLVIGATSGIGEALASRIVQNGSSVIVTGRRKERLAEFVQRHGKDKATAVPFDITELDKIPNFAANVTQTHPDLDCVIVNSGIQRGWQWSKPESIDLDVIQEEFTTNYISGVALTKAFLPFLQSKESESAIIYTTSSLGIIPMTRSFNYCASKAAMHAFITVLRQQLRDSKIKIVELYPPAVETELHDVDKQPDMAAHRGKINMMPLDEFTDKAYEGLRAGNEDVAVGIGEVWYEQFERPKRETFDKINGGSKA